MLEGKGCNSISMCFIRSHSFQREFHSINPSTSFRIRIPHNSTSLAMAPVAVMESSKVVTLALITVHVPVVTDADTKIRALLAVVVRLSTIWRWVAWANVRQVHLSRIILPAMWPVTILLLADHCAVILHTNPSIVWLIQHLPQLDSLKTGFMQSNLQWICD